jgi:DNA (cytosine-5)-methyltransferase 1
MRFGSVCSGIEAASVAWHPLGWQAAWFAEIEPFPSAVLSHHYPEVPNLGDLTKIARRILTGEVEAPDVLCGGTPCQAFSVAGLRQSLDDDRGNLTLKFVELADAIDHVRGLRGQPPAVVFWENVPGVLSTKDNAFGCFLAGLAGEDGELQPPGKRWEDAGAVLGPRRAVAWRTLDAQYFGLAQRRRRVFVVASARDDFDPAQVLFEWHSVRRDTAPSREAGQGAAGTITTRAGNGSRQAGEERGKLVAYGGNRTSGPIDVAPALNACGTASGRQDFESEAFITQQAHAFDARQSDVIQYGDKTGPLDTDGHTVGVLAFSAKDYGGDAMSDLSPTLRAGGHNTSHANAGVMPAVAFASATEFLPQSSRVYSEAEAAPTLQAAGARMGNRAPQVHAAMQVRRLTPRECERLQGFPDDYTLIAWRKKPASECPDGPRYKALGNSWAVPVVRWIGARIDRALRMKAAA